MFALNSPSYIISQMFFSLNKLHYDCQSFKGLEVKYLSCNQTWW